MRSAEELAFIELGNVTINDTDDDNIARKFFEVYYSKPRFILETFLFVLAILVNVATVLLLLYGSRKQKGTDYRTLFYNLSAVNIVCCLLSWMANNSLLIFEKMFDDITHEPEGLCRVFICLLAAMFISVAFGIEICLTMLGFTAVQYRCVSRPLVQWNTTRQKAAYMYLGGSWVFTLLFGSIPFGILFAMSNAAECTADMHSKALYIVVTGATVAITIEVVTSSVVIVLSALIYLKLRRYGQGFWNVRFNSQIRRQKRTFGTTLLLFVTLMLFSLPYMVLYVVTLNERHAPRISESIFIHYMNMLPYMKFLLDPIIYGIRMPEVKESWFKMLTKCGLRRYGYPTDEAISTPRSPPPYLMHNITFV